MSLFWEFGIKVINNQAVNMKSKILLSILVLLLSLAVFGQSPEKAKIGITYSPFVKSSLLENKKNSTLQIDFQQSTGVGVTFLKPINETFSLETGMEYNLIKLKSYAENSLLANDTSFSSLSMIEIPMAFRAEFADFIFFTGGVLLDFDLNSSAPISKQSGVGLMAGLGLNYDFKMGLSLFANPSVKLHSLVPFTSWENHQRIMDFGVKFGLMYRL